MQSPTRAFITLLSMLFNYAVILTEKFFVYFDDNNFRLEFCRKENKIKSIFVRPQRSACVSMNRTFVYTTDAATSSSYKTFMKYVINHC